MRQMNCVWPRCLNHVRATLYFYNNYIRAKLHLIVWGIKIRWPNVGARLKMNWHRRNLQFAPHYRKVLITQINLIWANVWWNLKTVCVPTMHVVIRGKIAFPQSQWKICKTMQRPVPLVPRSRPLKHMILRHQQWKF